MIASDHEWIMSALERISIFEHNLITTIHSDGGQRACVSDDCRDIVETVRYMYWGAPAPFRRNTVKDLGEVPPSAVRAKICADNLSQHQENVIVTLRTLTFIQPLSFTFTFKSVLFGTL